MARFRASILSSPDHAERVAAARKEALGVGDRLRVTRPENLCWMTRFVFSLVACFALAFTVVVAPPRACRHELGELVLHRLDVWAPLAICTAVVTLLGAVLSPAARTGLQRRFGPRRASFDRGLRSGALLQRVASRCGRQRRRLGQLH